MHSLALGIAFIRLHSVPPYNLDANHQLHSKNWLKSTFVIKVATTKGKDSATRPSYRMKLKYPFPLSVSSVQLNLLRIKNV